MYENKKQVFYVENVHKDSQWQTTHYAEEKKYSNNIIANKCCNRIL